jgi:hypothetical protein
MTSVAATAFPLDYIDFLPKIDELVKHIQIVSKPAQTPKKAADEEARSQEDTDDTDDFVLVEDDRLPSPPMPDISTMSIDSPTPVENSETRTSPFIDMIVREANENNALGRTENNALSYTTSLQPIVDLFYAVKEKSESTTIKSHLESAWQVDPLKALKLVFFLRDIRDGKGCSEEFYVAAEWLLRNHPKTFRYNVVRYAPRFGYWKDLLQLLVREYLGETAIEAEREAALENKAIYGSEERGRQANAQKSQGTHLRTQRPRSVSRRAKTETPTAEKDRALLQKKLRNKARRAKYAEMSPEEAIKARAQFAMEVEERQSEMKAKMKLERHEKRIDAIQKCQAHWSSNEEYRNLHLDIAKQFAIRLYLDKQRLLAKKKISSLCAKWAPSPGHYHDKHTRIATTIALILFPRSSNGRPSETDEEHISRALRLYQAQYLTPLREAAPVIETLMSSNRWDAIDYSHVPAVSFNRNKNAFKNHDEARYAQHVLDAAEGKEGKKIQAATLKPHEIVGKCMGGMGYHAPDSEANELDQQVLEAQWLNYTESIKKAGSLDNCIAVADVSGSMSGLPMQCSIALSLLVATVSRPPFNKTFITFSERPEFIVLPNEAKTLWDKVQFIMRMPWGMNTDFQAIFNLLLQKAKQHKLAKDDMVKTIFVFSDMQFDEACSSPLETDYQQIKRKFEEAGYDVPQIIFWNLRDSQASATPVLYDTIGTAMVSGWSGQLLKMFMEDGGNMLSNPEFSPEFVVNKAIDRPTYEVLKVLD